jgi:hypothetical protein
MLTRGDATRAATPASRASVWIAGSFDTKTALRALCPAMTTQKIVLATLKRPRFTHHHDTKKKSLPARKGSGAPKGACHPCPLTQTSGRNVRHSSAPRLRAPSKRGAPAFRRPRSRHSPKALTPMAQPQNRVSSRHGAPGVLPVRRACLELSTLRADRSLCRPTGDPEPPECGLAIPPAGTAPRSASLACLSGKALLVSELVLT